MGALTLAALAGGFALSKRERPRPSLAAVPAALRDAPRVLVLGSDPLPVATPLAPLLVNDQPDRLAVLEPSAGATRVQRGSAVVVRFNRPMVAAGAIGRPLASSPLRFTPEVRGATQWSSRSTLTFTAEEATWEATRETRLTVVQGLRALSGEALADDGSERVVVFDGAPRLVDPSDTRRVAAGVPLRLTFAGRVNASELQSQLLAYEVGGAMRPLTFNTRGAGRDTQGRDLVDVVLGRSLEPGARVALAFAPVLRPYSYDGEQPGVVTFEFAPRPQIEGVDCPDGESDDEGGNGCAYGARPGRVVDVQRTLRILASAEIDAASIQGVAVTPEVPNLRVEVDGARLSLTADWAPDQVYEVRLGALRSSEGIAIANVAPLAVRSAGLAPTVTVASGRLTWERAAPGTLPFATVNAARGVASVAPLDDAALVAALLSRSNAVTSRVALRPSALSALAPTARANRWGRGSLDWRQAAGGDAALVRFDPDGEGDAPWVESVAQRTDLGVSAVAVADGALVWVTSLSRAEPVAGTRVALYDETGTLAAQGVTSADGSAWIPLTRATMSGPTVVVARRGDDRAGMLLDARTAAGPATFAVSEGEAQRDERAPVAAVILDRGAYRPGERVLVKVVARVAQRGALRAFARQTVRVALTGPYGEVRGESVRLSRSGSADAVFELAGATEPGTYAVQVQGAASQSLGSASFQVAEFRQPNARVDLALPGGGATDGDRVAVGVRARYLFGAPVANGQARWSVRRVGSDEVPARWREFAFGPVDGEARNGTIAEGSGAVSADGSLSVEVQARSGAPVRERDVIEVTVRDPSGQETSARQNFTTFPAAYEVGLRRLAAWVEHGQALNVDAVVIGHDNNPVPNVSVEAMVYREGWHGYYEWARGGGEEGDDGRWQARRDHQRELVHTCTVTSGVEAVRCAWQPTAPGTYVVEATVTDAQGKRSVSAQRVYVAGPTEHPDRDAPGAPITLTPVRAEWFEGERSRLSFECPWPEAEALVAVVREGVLHQERRRVQAGTVVLELPVTPAMVPNAFVTVTIVRPRTGDPRALGELDLGSPDVRWGVTELTVRPRQDPLSVQVQARAESTPDADVPVEVSVRDARGQGVATEVLLYAVDEGVLRLTSYEAPDPSRALLPRRAPRFSLEDLRRTVVSRIALPALPNASGDGDDDTNGVVDNEPLRDQRERFDPTPLWLPRLTTDAEGRARAVLHLPNRAGQYRLMAVAVGEGLRSGRASMVVSARRDVAVRALLPRAVTEGDRFEAGALLNNTADHPVTAELALLRDGREVARRSVTLAAGAETRIAETVEASGTRMDLAWEVRAGSDRTRDGRVVPVGARSFAGRGAIVGAFDGRTELTLTRTAGTTDPVAALTVSTQPFLGLDAAAEDLDAERWGGTEAVLSRVLGWAALSRADGHRASQWSSRQAGARGGVALGELREIQGPSGGFGTWAASEYPDAYLTAYALRALAAAKREGWRVDDAVERAAVQSLSRWVRERPAMAGGSDELAFALRALHDVGADQGAAVTQLFEQREVLGAYGNAQLAMAMMPNDPRRDTLLVAAGRLVGATASVARPSFFDTRPRTLAAVLEAAVRTNRYTLAREVAGQLLAARAGVTGAGWGNAHATAQAIDALALYASRFAEDRTLQARVWIDGREVQPQRLGDGTARFAFDPALLAAGEHRVRVEGTGTLFTALDGRWRTPIGEAETVARGRALALHRVLETDGGRALNEGDTVRVGEMVRVRLWVYAEQRTAPYLVIRSAHGGGFEAVDEGLDTTPQGSIEALLGMSSDDAQLDPRVFHALRSLSDITARRLYGGAATFRFDQGVQGLREYTYGVRATTPGRFLVPPAEARALYDASTVARSAMQTLVVAR